MDLARAFLESNIALHKISHPSIKKFLEKHTKHASPSETVLRTKCLPTLYGEAIEKMKLKAKNNFVWVSLDETTDSEQRYIANFVFGDLGVADERDKSYLFAIKVLNVTNNSTIATFFDESLKDLGKSSYFKFWSTLHIR